MFVCYLWKSCYRGGFNRKGRSTMKKCPYCAEQIQDEAIVCRYCGRDLPAPRKPAQRTKEEKRQVRKNQLILAGGLAFFLFCCFIAASARRTPVTPTPTPTTFTSGGSVSIVTYSPTVTHTVTVTNTPTNTNSPGAPTITNTSTPTRTSIPTIRPLPTNTRVVILPTPTQQPSNN